MITKQTATNEWKPQRPRKPARGKNARPERPYPAKRSRKLRREKGMPDAFLWKEKQRVSLFCPSIAPALLL